MGVFIEIEPAGNLTSILFACNVNAGAIGNG